RFAKLRNEDMRCKWSRKEGKTVVHEVSFNAPTRILLNSDLE
ncbi:18314_t:CDS:1, partial [Acaulospora morrowiae]